MLSTEACEYAFASDDIKGITPNQLLPCFSRIVYKALPMKPVFLILCIVVLSACSQLNKSHRKIYLHTEEGVLVSHETDSLLCTEEALPLSLKRQKEDHIIVLRKDSVEKTIALSHNISGAYWFNFMSYGIGYIIDLLNHRRFTYPKHIYTSVYDTAVSYRNYQPVMPAQTLLFQISLPSVNYLFQQPDGYTNPKQGVGSAGIGLGLDYYYKDDHFIHSYFLMGTDVFFIPPVPQTFLWAQQHNMSFMSICLSHGQRAGRFSMSQGLSFSRNYFWPDQFWGDDFNFNQTARSVTNVYGFYFDLYLQLNHNFYLGVIYKPSVWRVSGERPQAYEHSVSLDLSWKLPLRP